MGRLAWRRTPASPPPAGILASRRVAQPALLRMLSRARRHESGLALLAMAPEAGAAEGLEPMLAGLAAELRIGDLLWQEPGGRVLVLLEDAGEAAAAAVLARLQALVRQTGRRPEWQVAHFPRQALTLEALLEQVRPGADAGRTEAAWVTR